MHALIDRPDPTTPPDAPPIVALVGSDGSGKSTVGAALLEWMQARRPTVLCHLGKQTGNVGRRIARWPLIGGRLTGSLNRKADRAKEPGGPGLLTAGMIYLFSMRRVRRFRRMLAARAQGHAILADRYPQVEIAGPMDGLGLSLVTSDNPLIRALAAREQRHYRWMAGHRPDLVIRLVVDLATAQARKPDHRASSLRTKIDDLARLRFGGAPIVDIDATQPLEQVIAQAKRAIAAIPGGGFDRG